MKDLVTSVTPVNELWIKLKNIITDSQQQYVPTKTTSKRFNQPWFNHECKVCKKVRRYRVFKRTNLPKDWLNFQQEAKTCRLICKKVYNTYIKQNFTECDDYRSNKKILLVYQIQTIWHYRCPTTERCWWDHPCKRQGNIRTLKYTVASVFSYDDGSSPEVEGPPGSEINNIVFTRNGIIKLLNALNHKKASGSDGISARIFKVCSEEVADALVLIFSASINQGKIPDDWRHASGNKNRTNPENYRPIVWHL